MGAPDSKMTWEKLDWPALDRLRERFLAGRAAQPQSGGEVYWRSWSDLASYDFTFAQRIGWKWDAVLRELKQRRWRPPPGPLLDWGCGSGIAGRRVLAFLQPELPSRFELYDHSSLAMEFAESAARAQFPTLGIEKKRWTDLEEGPSGGTLLVSHVLNELDEAGGRALRHCLDRTQAVLWVEPGTFADSRALIALRESLRTQFDLVAPCPHQEVCGLLAAGNERHWCHQFAPGPPGIMGDSNWVRFAQRAGVDLRSLPYSYLVMERKGTRAESSGPQNYSRILGQPRVYKGFAKILSCQASGVSELELQKRVQPAVFKAFKNGDAPSLWRYTLEGRRIVGLEE